MRALAIVAAAVSVLLVVTYFFLVRLAVHFALGLLFLMALAVMG